MTPQPIARLPDDATAGRRITWNTVANFLATVWSAVLNLAFVPVYIRLLGVESYGLVALFATIQAALAILDFGLSPTMTREMARGTVSDEAAREARDLARTLEVGYWTLAAAIAAALVLAAPFLAAHWVRATAIPATTVVGALAIMGVTAGSQWPLSFYAGGLRGLQAQVLLNAINMSMATLRYGGAAVVLWKVSRDVTGFFAWQAAASALHAVLLLWVFWRAMPRGPRPRARLALVRRVWRFAAGVGAISLTSLVITQADKVVVSATLSLEEFGYYSIATLLAQSLASVAAPITTAILPRFTQLAAQGEPPELVRLYHRAAQALAIGIGSAGLVLVFFAREVIALWTRSSVTADRSHLNASLLVIGAMLGSFPAVPFALLLAIGHTRAPLVITAMVAAIAFPTLMIAVKLWGASGAACAWILFNLLALGPIAWAVHGRMLKEAHVRWYLADTLAPLMGAMIPIAAGRFLLPVGLSSGRLLSFIVVVSCAAVAGAATCSSEIRGLVAERARRLSRVV